MNIEEYSVETMKEDISVYGVSNLYSDIFPYTKDRLSFGSFKNILKTCFPTTYITAFTYHRFFVTIVNLVAEDLLNNLDIVKIYKRDNRLLRRMTNIYFENTNKGWNIGSDHKKYRTDLLDFDLSHLDLGSFILQFPELGFDLLYYYGCKKEKIVELIYIINEDVGLGFERMQEELIF